MVQGIFLSTRLVSRVIKKEEEEEDITWSREGDVPLDKWMLNLLAWQVHPGTAVGHPPFLGHGQVAPILFDDRLPLSSEIGMKDGQGQQGFWPWREPFFMWTSSNPLSLFPRRSGAVNDGAARAGSFGCRNQPSSPSDASDFAVQGMFLSTRLVSRVIKKEEEEDITWSREGDVPLDKWMLNLLAWQVHSGAAVGRPPLLGDGRVASIRVCCRMKSAHRKQSQARSWPWREPFFRWKSLNPLSARER